MANNLRKDRALIAVGILAAAMILFIVIFIAATAKGSVSSEKIQPAAETVTLAESTVTTTAAVTTTQITTTIAHIAEPNCKSAALYSVSGGKMLYSDNINEKVAPASLTKLMTAAVALKYVNINAVFTVGSEQSLVNPDSSLCGLDVGDMLTMYDLISGLLMSSGNDAAYTIAVCTARACNPEIDMTNTEAVEYFCGLMNSFADYIGMKDSHFTTPDGWDDDEQYTTVADLLILAKYALSVAEIKEISGISGKDLVIDSGKSLSWKNSNELLDPSSPYYYEGVFGMKTGTTDNAGNSLITAYKKNRKTYLAVVVGCETDSDRYELTTKLLEYCK